MSFPSEPAATGLTSRLLAAGVLLCAAAPLIAGSLPSLVANDNRTSAGELHGNVLSLHLEIKKGVWHPEAEDGEAIPAYAFAEEGKPLQVPAPAIRVPQGATIDIFLRNGLAVPATVHGLHSRPGSEADVIVIAPGATREIRFAAGAPGTYLYWARTPDGGRGNGRLLDALLGGALVVDPPGPAAPDRIFVLERWNGPTRTAINGKSWPYTERLSYKVGDRVRWRVVNASDLSHPMHLHGFHFALDAESDGEHTREYEPGDEPIEFTHSVQIAETFDMTWIPSEPGRWLYHCHRIPHMRLPVPLDPQDALVVKEHDHEQMHDMNSPYAGMGGMIMGITITGRSAIDTTTNWNPQRRLELSVASRNRDSRFYELSLRDLARPLSKPGPEPAQIRKSTGLTGPVIVLQQNQPAEIEVVNKLNEPTSIHWHGMELESYYDGVPGFGGRDEKKSPAVEPGKTFEVRIIPPRAGTFIYHTHWHDDAQLTGGVHGPLIVMAPGETYDPTVDKSFLFSIGPLEPFGSAMLLMNGVPQPTTMKLKTGTMYRLRFMNITPALDNLRVSLRKAGTPVEWRLLAKDASNVKSSPMREADQMIAIGETYDFEYRAAQPEELTLTGLAPGDNRRAVQTLVFSDR
jgi:FtsP/CotA-like multicopper oxidase with cupredoxin domain